MTELLGQVLNEYKIENFYNDIGPDKFQCFIMMSHDTAFFNLQFDTDRNLQNEVEQDLELNTAFQMSGLNALVARNQH